MNDLTREQLRQLDKEQLIDTILELRTQLAAVEARLREVEGQRAKNSRNSSKPPSSDDWQKKSRSARETGQRKPGGQAGHTGHTLSQVEQPDHVVHHALSACPHCQTDMREVTASGIEKRQVFDLPVVRIEVTEHHGQVKVCPGCAQRSKAPFPAGVERAVQYGPRIQAHATYLTMYQLLPVQRTCELLADVYGHAPSEAMVLESMAQVQAHIQPSLRAIQQHLLAAPVLHADETGMRVEGRRQWVHVASTSTLTYYMTHRKRGQEALRAMDILPHFRGVCVHDGWRSYFHYDAGSHALCNAHHLRELRFIEEEYDQPWAGEMAQLLREAKREVAACPPDQPALSADRVAWYHQAYEALLRAGFHANPPPAPAPKTRGRPKQSPPKNLLDRLQKYQQETLAFLTDFRIPFDNNLAERDLRMMKVKQKISGTFRTQRGAAIFCDIRSYISTVRKQGHSVIHALLDAIGGAPFVPT